MCNCQLQQDHLWAFGGEVSPDTRRKETPEKMFLKLM